MRVRVRVVPGDNDRGLVLIRQSLRPGYCRVTGIRQDCPALEQGGGWALLSGLLRFQLVFAWRALVKGGQAGERGEATRRKPGGLAGPLAEPLTSKRAQALAYGLSGGQMSISFSVGDRLAAGCRLPADVVVQNLPSGLPAGEACLSVFSCMNRFAVVAPGRGFSCYSCSNPSGGIKRGVHPPLFPWRTNCRPTVARLQAARA